MVRCNSPDIHFSMLQNFSHGSFHNSSFRSHENNNINARKYLMIRKDVSGMKKNQVIMLEFNQLKSIPQHNKRFVGPGREIDE
jgi:hypothetical protein